MRHVDELAIYFCHQQPQAIQERILNSETFRAQFGASDQKFLTISRDIHFEESLFFAAVRQLLTLRLPQKVENLDGKEFVLEYNQETGVMRLASEQGEIHIPDLKILSPHYEERVSSLKKIIDKMGPTAANYADIQHIAEQRELGNEEVEALLEEQSNCVAAIQERTLIAFQTGKLSLTEISPSSLEYYEKFSGPEPGHTEVGEYLKNQLPKYRKHLLHRDLMRGLDICLLGAIHDCLLPGQWLKDFSNDEVWNALEACNPWRDPFSLIGALDIALIRQEDHRYRLFSEKAVSVLIRGNYARGDGIDVYELMSVFAGLVLNRVNTVENGALKQPFWKKMCAWMQAGLLTRYSEYMRIDLEHLRKWCQRVQSPIGAYAGYLGLRDEPLFRASEISRSALYEEIVSRLVILQGRHEMGGQEMPCANEIDEVVRGMSNEGWPLHWPGPLEGSFLPSDSSKRALPETDKNENLEQLNNDTSEIIWSKLAHLSQLFDLGPEILHRAQSILKNSESGSRLTNPVFDINYLQSASLIAAAQRDVELASAIGDKLLDHASSVRSESDVASIMVVLLIASSAFQNDDTWTKWVENKFAEVAMILSADNLLKVFLRHLQELKKLIKLNKNIISRAEAIASSAM